MGFITRNITRDVAYLEIYTDLRFISISAIPFELRCLEKQDIDNEIEDGFHCNSISNLICTPKIRFPQWRKHSVNKIVKYGM